MMSFISLDILEWRNVSWGVIVENSLLVIVILLLFFKWTLEFAIGLLFWDSNSFCICLKGFGFSFVI